MAICVEAITYGQKNSWVNRYTQVSKLQHKGLKCEILWCVFLYEP
jgi:hypothetical protein